MSCAGGGISCQLQGPRAGLVKELFLLAPTSGQYGLLNLPDVDVAPSPNKCLAGSTTRVYWRLCSRICFSL
jgi:hypothetical protein